jgi:hypothetical protein
MAFEFSYYTIAPGQEVRLYYQFNNYQYAGPKVFQARPLSWGSFLICSDVGTEIRRIGNGFNTLYVYSVPVKHIGTGNVVFSIVGGDVS